MVTYQNVLSSPPKKQGYGIVIIRDGMSDEEIWENIRKSDEKITAFLVDLRAFPRETTDELLSRLDKQFGNRNDKKKNQPRNKL